MSDLDKAFGNAVRQRRKQLEISQEELGLRAGIHRTYISQIERGLKSPSLNVMGFLAQALGIDVSQLIKIAEDLQKSPRNDDL